MKARTFLVPLALLAVPAVAYANQSGTMTARTWDRGTHILTGEVGTSTEAHRHLSTTAHLAVIDPNQIPAGACRDVAIDWNGGVAHSEPWTWFEDLIAESAAEGCKFDFVRSTTQNTDGSYDLVSLTPGS